MNPQTNVAADRRVGRKLTRRARLAGALGLLGLAGALGAGPVARAPPAPAPSAPAAAPPVQIRVTRAQDRPQLIPVAVSQGVLVDFSVPIREVHVANPEIADVAVTSPRQILVNGKSFGTTQLVAMIDGGAQSIFTIAVDLDLERLQASILKTAPRAKVQATGLLDTVVLSGTIPDSDAAERIMQIAGVYSKNVINHMRVAGVQQVVLRCTVAEVNRTATRQLGFNGWMAGSNFPDMFVVQQVGGINPVNIGGAKEVSVSGRIPFATDQQSGLPLTQVPTLSFGFPQAQMQIFIKALRENGLLRVLAEPNLVTVSGQEASFLAGGELPIPVQQRDSISIEYREYGIRLVFTPTIVNENAIRLRVAPEVSEPDFSTAVRIGGFVVPGLIQRRVETVVELGSGQTFAIGGMLSDKTRATSGRIPALGDVPVLGSLFSSIDYQSEESELVVLVTPELVEPLNPGQSGNIPGSDYVVPNDWELFLLGQLDGEGTPGHKPVAERASQEAARPVRTSPPGSTAVRLRGPIGPAGEDEGT